MEIGVPIPHTGAQASPEFIREWCTVADEAGFGSLWTSDHLVLPQHTDSPYVLPRKPAAIADDSLSSLLSPNFEQTTTMAFAAAVTRRIKIGAAVAVLPIRNAVLNARQIATVDRYSCGRVLYGVGVGWLKEEADAMNMPWDRRGARTDEQIALMRAIWTAPGKIVEFHGQFWNIPPMDPEPRPAQQSVPILIGGHSQAAIDRAAQLGDGWIAGRMSLERLSDSLALLRSAALRCDRDPDSIPVYCGAANSAATVKEFLHYKDLGVHSLLVSPKALGELTYFAEKVLPHLR